MTSWIFCMNTCISQKTHQILDFHTMYLPLFLRYEPFCVSFRQYYIKIFDPTDITTLQRIKHLSLRLQIKIYLKIYYI